MEELYVLYFTSATLAFFHTLLGPDHYVPFIVLSKARKWSVSKTLWITLVSGIGHVGSSVILGMIGIGLGISITKLESVEAFRGEIVGWMLLAFGIIYFMYGIYKYMKSKGHHNHFFMPRRIKNAHHISTGENETKENDKTNVTFWVLFLIFVFGPCEVLIPMLIFPAAEHSTTGIILVAVIFGIVTVLTMIVAVYMGYRGLKLVKVKKREEAVHILAGLVIAFLGISIQFLGW